MVPRLGDPKCFILDPDCYTLTARMFHKCEILSLTSTIIGIHQSDRRTRKDIVIGLQVSAACFVLRWIADNFTFMAHAMSLSQIIHPQLTVDE